jgi:hypothetical protein
MDILADALGKERQKLPVNDIDRIDERRKDQQPPSTHHILQYFGYEILLIYFASLVKCASTKF